MNALNTQEKDAKTWTKPSGWALRLVRAGMLPKEDFRREAREKTKINSAAASSIDLDLFLRTSLPKLFIWVPKTAGTSLMNWFQKAIGSKKFISAQDFGESQNLGERTGLVTFGHWSIDSLIEHGFVKSETLNSVESFAFVRHPVRRAESLFRYAVNYGAIPTWVTFRVFLKTIARQKPEIGLFNWAGLSMACPMVSWINQRYWNGPTKVMRYENFMDEVAEMAREFGITSPPPYLNTTRSGRDSVPVGRTELRIIEELYHDDFKIFDYPTDPLDIENP